MSHDQVSLQSPLRSDVPFRSTNGDDGAAEATDTLPSLPSSSSSLFVAANLPRQAHPANNRSSSHTYAQSTTATPSQRRRVASLYGNPSIAASDTISIEGASTYEYDILSNIQKQQHRRRRGDSNASISTVVSVLSRNLSIAESLSPSIQAYERDGHAHGQFTTAARARVRGSESGAPSVYEDDGAYNDDDGQSIKSAAASLRRIRRANERNFKGGAAKVGNGGLPSNASHDGQGAVPHLTDKLEQLIANSTSYRAAARGRGQPTGEDEASEDGWFQPRHRKNSYASMRSLIGFVSSTTQQQRQSSTGEYYSPSLRGGTASLFGVYMGRQSNNATDASSKGAHPAFLRSTALRSAPLAQVSEASASAGNERTSLPPQTSPRKALNRHSDAIGSLRGLRGIFPPDQARQHSNAPDAHSRLVAKRALNKSTFTPSLTTAEPRAGRVDGKVPDSPTSPGGNSQRHVSFRSSKHPAQTDSASEAGPPHKSILLNNPVAQRRAFAAMDPTSSAGNSGSITPRTIRSNPSSLHSNSRTSSRVDLPAVAAAAAATTCDDSARLSVPNSPTAASPAGSGQSSHGAMPALDAALARAEDRSGLKTSSRCTTCGKRVVNAPVSRSGNVFCSRDCRIEHKRTQRQAAEKSTAPTTTANGTSSSDASPLPSDPPSSVTSPSLGSKLKLEPNATSNADAPAPAQGEASLPSHLHNPSAAINTTPETIYNPSAVAPV